MGIFEGRRKWQGEEHHWIKQHSLSVVLAVIMIAQTVYAVWAGAYVFSREQPLGEGIPTMGREFWAWWSWEYNISLVADTYGVLLIVILTKWLYEQDSAESDKQNAPAP